ncbi:MAG TPA: hypothetical protein VND65_15840, partial [Candidatus Binatia bacterium]|nr:hypothetical protein [Candidatus Binatia bacterium]
VTNGHSTKVSTSFQLSAFSFQFSAVSCQVSIPPGGVLKGTAPDENKQVPYSFALPHDKVPDGGVLGVPEG